MEYPLALDEWRWPERVNVSDQYSSGGVGWMGGPHVAWRLQEMALSIL